jgi:hypothetical protein
VRKERGKKKKKDAEYRKSILIGKEIREVRGTLGNHEPHHLFMESNMYS